jgi:hypothetical protein
MLLIWQSFEFVQSLPRIRHLIFNYIVHCSVFSQRLMIKAITTVFIWMAVWARSLAAHLNYIAKEWEFFHWILSICTTRTITIWFFSICLTLILMICTDLFSIWIDYFNRSIKGYLVIILDLIRILPQTWFVFKRDCTFSINLISFDVIWFIWSKVYLNSIWMIAWLNFTLWRV